MTLKATATVEPPSDISPPKPQRPPSAENVATASDDIVFVRLRSELEKTLKELAIMFGLKPNVPSQILLRRLREAGVISLQQQKGIRSLLALGSRQLHGAPVDAAVADYARTEGDALLKSLQRLPEYEEQEILNAIITLARQSNLTVSAPQKDVDLLVDQIPIEVKVGASPLSGSLALRQL
ncbi:MAG TPA: hypothetical protein VIX83_03250 [Candidatus Cybelea sp.]